VAGRQQCGSGVLSRNNRPHGCWIGWPHEAAGGLAGGVDGWGLLRIGTERERRLWTFYEPHEGCSMSNPGTGRPWTLDDELAFDMGFALPRAPVRGLKRAFTDEERREIARAIVAHLKLC